MRNNRFYEYFFNVKITSNTLFTNAIIARCYQGTNNYNRTTLWTTLSLSSQQMLKMSSSLIHDCLESFQHIVYCCHCCFCWDACYCFLDTKNQLLLVFWRNPWINYGLKMPPEPIVARIDIRGSRRPKFREMPADNSISKMLWKELLNVSRNACRGTILHKNGGTNLPCFP